MSHGKESAGDPFPPKCALIEVRVAELKQLFNSIDPSPFRNKDLDPRAEEFIIGWAKDLPKDAPLGLVVDLDRPAGLPDEAAVLRDAVHEFFSQRAHAYRRRLRELFRLGRTSLIICLVVLAAAIALGDFLSSLLKSSHLGEILRESLTIGGCGGTRTRGSGVSSAWRRTAHRRQHAEVSTTMDVYGNALMESKREANSKVVRMVLRQAV